MSFMDMKSNFFNTTIITRIFFVFLLGFLIATIGRNLLPVTDQMFDFHDTTLPSRVSEFIFNIKEAQIPPRLVPQYSFNMGLPIFNFYAPFAYWITSIFAIFGLDVLDSIKISFLSALIMAFTGMYLLLKQKFTNTASLLGAAFYASSPYFAVEVFIRGNIAEAWFLGLFPFTLYLLYKNSESRSKHLFVCTVIILSFIFTVHNVFSLLMIVILPIYIVLHKKIKKNILAIVLALTFSSYFLIPAVFELNLTHATYLVGGNYADHFLCLKQLWSIPQWDYGVSLPGCDSDTLPFLLGKLQIIMGVSGFLISIIFLFLKHKEIKKHVQTVFYMLLFVISIFLTTYSSAFVWTIFKPILSLFQFPWRFLVFGVFGLAYFAGFITNMIDRKIKYVSIIFILLAAFSLYYNSKFFVKVTMDKAQYKKNLLSDTVIKTAIAYKIPEYLPLTVDYKEWLQYEPQVDGSEKKHILSDGFIIPLEKGNVINIKNEAFIKEAKTNSKKFKVNIHYFPFWQIYINGEKVVPTKFDLLGRPIFSTKNGEKNVKITYQQTTLEMVGNIITILTGVFLIFFITFKKIKIESN